MLEKKQFNICLIILIITGSFAIIMVRNSFIDDKRIIDGFKGDTLQIYFFNKYINHFNYLHGLWLIPTGLFFIMLLILLEIPSFEDIYHEFKKQLKTMLNNIRAKNP